MDASSEHPVEMAPFDRAALARKQWRGFARAVDKAREAVEALCKIESNPSPDPFVARQAAEALAKALEGPAGSADELLTATRRWAADVQARAIRDAEALRASLARDVANAAEELGLVVSGRLPELRCGVLTVVFDFAQGRATLWFGPRVEKLTSVALDAASIGAAMAQAIERLRAAATPPEAFVEAVHEAWTVAVVRARQSLQANPFVPLADVWRTWVWVRQSPRFHEAPSRARFEDATRAEFAYALGAVRSTPTSRGLAVRLRTATRQETRKRGGSLWIPQDRTGRGAHFSAMSFAPAPGAPAAEVPR